METCAGIFSDTLFDKHTNPDTITHITNETKMSQPNFKVIGTNATGKSKVYPRNGGTLSKKEAQRLSSKLLVRSPMDITDTSFDVVSVEVVEIIMRQSLEQQSTIKELT